MPTIRRDTGKWQARVWMDGQPIHCGSHDTREQAEVAENEAWARLRPGEKRGSRSRRQVLHDEKLMIAFCRYKAGDSLERIAEDMPISRDGVRAKLMAAGVKMRTRRNDPMAPVSVGSQLQRALAAGELVRPDTCEECGAKPPPNRRGASAIHAHHDDYNFPLDVRWLCVKCHHAWHSEHVAIPASGNPPLKNEVRRQRRVERELGRAA